ncbi:MAG: retropepsin-like aspartic protease, partial [Anaplasma sp.]|nr:retropepsin-like aspartic protease [Anaplasma sp.]
MNEAVCQRLQMTPSKSSLKLVGANGLPLENNGEVSVEITVDGRSFRQTFVVVPHLKEDLVLLGDDFLRSSKAFIDWGTNTFSIQAEKPVKVYATTTQVVPPLSRKVIEVMLEVPASETSRDIFYVTSSQSAIERYLLELQPTVIDAGTKTFKLLATNFSLRPSKIPARASLGSAEKIESVEAVDLSPIEWESVLQCSSFSDLENREEVPIVRNETQQIIIDELSFNVGASLNSEELEAVTQLLMKYRSSFATDTAHLGSCRIEKHSIPTGDAKPIAQYPRRISPAQRDLVKAMIKDLMDAKIIQPSKSSWASPLFLVQKKD